MADRIRNLIACLTGCIVASLLGLLFLLRFDSVFPAMVTAGAVPAAACRMSGITDHRQLWKIAIYAGIGWMLGFMLQPVVAQSSSSHVRRILELPLLGYDWHIHGSVVSTLLALIGVSFVPAKDPDSSGPPQDDRAQPL